MGEVKSVYDLLNEGGLLALLVLLVVIGFFVLRYVFLMVIDQWKQRLADNNAMWAKYCAALESRLTTAEQIAMQNQETNDLVGRILDRLEASPPRRHNNIILRWPYGSKKGVRK